jgi:DNA-binding Lrp family transcriptional regulator
MVRAYVLINADPGKTGEALKKTVKIKGVKFAEAVTGPFDIIALVEGADFNQLGKLVVAKIQKVAGVRGTLTNPVVEL